MGRVKGCINHECSANQEKRKYKENDIICAECGQDLSYVCTKCFTALAESDGKYCIRCSENKKDKRDKTLKIGGTAFGVLATVATIAVTIVSAFKSDDKKE